MINETSSTARRVLTVGLCTGAAALLAACSSSGTPDAAAAASRETRPMNERPTVVAGRPVEAELAAFRASFNDRADDQTKELFQRYGVDAQKPVTERALNVGDTAPDFTLPNAVGESVTLNELLRDGPVIITWYRGGWCPYCNIQLRGFQDILPEITDAGAQLVAISPELPDNSLDTREKQGLEFHVLSDRGNIVAQRFNIVYQFADPLRDRFGQMLENANGDSSGELPLAVTYVIDTDGKISYAFVDNDYRKRAEPADALAAVQALR